MGTNKVTRGIIIVLTRDRHWNLS